MHLRPATERYYRSLVFNQKTREFEFRPGPAFSHVLLADEINRATPRTQSALLEAMGEAQVTVNKVTTRYQSRSWFSQPKIRLSSKGFSPCPGPIGSLPITPEFRISRIRGRGCHAANAAVCQSHRQPGPVVEAQHLPRLQEQVRKVYVAEASAATF